MKLKILFFLIITFSICSSQMKPALIVLKNGEKLQGIGKIKSSTFKFKTHQEAKPQEFEFSKIKFVEIELYDKKRTIYRFYQTKNNEEYIAVEEVVSGNKMELFTTNFTYHSGGMPGGMGFSQSVTRYFIKKQNEERLTELGEYSPLTNNLKGKVREYFSDCKSLIEKLENRDFKVRDGLENIVLFYNENCD